MKNNFLVKDNFLIFLNKSIIIMMINNTNYTHERMFKKKEKKISASYKYKQVAIILVLNQFFFLNN